MAFLLKKPVLAGLAGLVIITMLGLGYRHYTGLLDRVETLQAQSATLTLGLDTERAAVVDLLDVVGEWEKSQADLVGKIKEMQNESNEARAETRRLRELFAELDFDDLAPAALDSLADDTTDRLWRLIDDATDPRRYGSSGTAAGEADSTSAGSGPVSGRGLAGSSDTERPSPGADGDGVPNPNHEPR